MKVGDRVRLKADWSHRGVLIIGILSEEDCWLVRWDNGHESVVSQWDLEIIG